VAPGEALNACSTRKTGEVVGDPKEQQSMEGRTQSVAVHGHGPPGGAFLLALKEAGTFVICSGGCEPLFGTLIGKVWKDFSAVEPIRRHGAAFPLAGNSPAYGVVADHRKESVRRNLALAHSSHFGVVTEVLARTHSGTPVLESSRFCWIAQRHPWRPRGSIVAISGRRMSLPARPKRL